MQLQIVLSFLRIRRQKLAAKRKQENVTLGVKCSYRNMQQTSGKWANYVLKSSNRNGSFGDLQ